MNLKVSIVKEGNIDVLRIEMPLQNPAPSKTGKSLIVATTSGIVKTNLEVAGKPVSVGLNAFIPR